MGPAIFHLLRGIPIKEDNIDTFKYWIKRLKLCISVGKDLFEWLN
jgi:hypothetical protein